MPLGKPLLNQQQYPARIIWRFLIRAGAAAPLSNFALHTKLPRTRKASRNIAGLIAVDWQLQVLIFIRLRNYPAEPLQKAAEQAESIIHNRTAVDGFILFHTGEAQLRLIKDVVGMIIVYA